MSLVHFASVVGRGLEEMILEPLVGLVENMMVRFRYGRMVLNIWQGRVEGAIVGGGLVKRA